MVIFGGSIGLDGGLIELITDAVVRLGTSLLLSYLLMLFYTR